MAEPFDVCWERIARADTRRKSVSAAWNAIEVDESYSACVDVKDDGAGRIWIEHVKPLPVVVALEIGEMLYQLRAALDSCIYEVACLNSGERPPKHENTLEFPITPSPEDFKKAAWKITPLTKEQLRIVEGVQPYNAPNNLTAYELAFNFNRALGILNDWARKDRHRKLHVVRSWGSDVRPLLACPAGVNVLEFVVTKSSFLVKDECEIATFRLSGWKRGMSIDANPNLAIDIALDEVPLPCHDADTLGNRFVTIKHAVGAVVHALGQTVGVNRTK